MIIHKLCVEKFKGQEFNKKGKCVWGYNHTRNEEKKKSLKKKTTKGKEQLLYLILDK